MEVRLIPMKAAKKKKIHALTEPDHHAINTRIGHNIRALRIKANMSQIDLGRLFNLHQSAISRIESGEQVITPAELALVSKVFNVSFDALAFTVIELD